MPCVPTLTCEQRMSNLDQMVPWDVQKEQQASARSSANRNSRRTFPVPQTVTEGIFELISWEPVGSEQG